MTRNIPRLVFHGTAAVSVWYSYQEGRALKNLLNRSPKKAKKLIENSRALDCFHNLGPLYPSTCSHKKEASSVHVTADLETAVRFAMKWIGHPIKKELHFDSFANRYFDLPVKPPIHRAIRKMMRKESEMVRGLTLLPGAFNTPGAVLIVNGHYLRDNDLLIDGKRYITNYLPWEAIEGAFIVNPTNGPIRQLPTVSSFWIKNPTVRDPNIWQDLFELSGFSRSISLGTNIFLPAGRHGSVGT